MEKCKKSYVLTDFQLEESSRIIKELRKKYSKYDFIIGKSVFDDGIYVEITKEELDLVEED